MYFIHAQPNLTTFSLAKIPSEWLIAQPSLTTLSLAKVYSDWSLAHASLPALSVSKLFSGWSGVYPNLNSLSSAKTSSDWSIAKLFLGLQPYHYPLIGQKVILVLPASHLLNYILIGH